MKLIKKADYTEIQLVGEIVDNDDKWYYDYFGIENTCPGEVTEALNALIGGTVLVSINSPGGSVIAGSQLYTAIKQFAGSLTMEIVGMAASAASVVAMAGYCRMSPTALMMVHNSQAVAQGDYRQMEHSAYVLKQANEAIINAYALKSGRSREELAALMNEETWLPAQRALELGFIDEVLFCDKGDSLQLDSLLKSAYAGLSNNIKPLSQDKKQQLVALMAANTTSKTSTKNIKKIEIEKKRYGGNYE